MQSARSILLRWMAVFPLTLAMAFVPAGWSELPTPNSPNPRAAIAGQFDFPITAGIAASPGRVSVLSTAAPAITSLSPASAIARAADFKLTVNGIHFTSTSTVKWGTQRS